MRSVVRTAVIVPVAAFCAAGGGVLAAGGDTDPVVENAAPCCLEIVTVAPSALSSTPFGGHSSMSSAAGQIVSASRWRVAALPDIPRLLPVGVAPEEGLQVRTILAARSIGTEFPEIQNIGGVRADYMRWHPNGLALDVMIPNPGAAEGIALGNEIVAFVLKNKTRFGLQDAIWRGTYFTPNGRQGTGYGHYDHVHITTTGGGYPTGGETYYSPSSSARP